MVMTQGVLMAAVDTPSPAVPADIGIVRDFVNTTDHELGTDELTTPAEVTAYLFGVGLMSRRSRATDGDVRLARQLRAGLRKALELNHLGESGAVPELDAALDELPMELRWTGDRVALAPTVDGVRGGLARVAIAMSNAVAEGIWWRLKVCSSDDCEWAYYDKSKNRSARWCEYSCGDKLKMRAYRERQRAKTS
jgi:predicted RNA-binding Zn ribbon-like protein